MSWVWSDRAHCQHSMRAAAAHGSRLSHGAPRGPHAGRCARPLAALRAPRPVFAAGRRPMAGAWLQRTAPRAGRAERVQHDDVRADAGEHPGERVRVCVGDRGGALPAALPPVRLRVRPVTLYPRCRPGKDAHALLVSSRCEL